MVEADTSHRLIWFWPIASGLSFAVGFVLFQEQQTALLASFLLGLIPLGIWCWLEFHADLRPSKPILTWHRNRLYLYDKGKLAHKIYSGEIEHIQLAQGFGHCVLIIHRHDQVIRQNFLKLGRSQKLQIQRIVRLLDAEITYRDQYDALPAELESIRAEIGRAG